MIVPTDYNLLENVSFYNPSNSRIFFKKAFWSSFFPRLMKDFKEECGVQIPDVGTFVIDIKTAMFNYYYTKFVLQKTEVGSLHGSLQQVFSHHVSKVKPDTSDYRLARVLPVGATDATLVEPATTVPHRYVDDLLDDFKAMERQSTAELELQVAYDEFAAQFEREETWVKSITPDEMQSLSHLVDKDRGFAGAVRTTFNISKHYEEKIGMPTIFNLIKHFDGFYDLKKRFRIDFFHIFNNHYRRFEVYNKLIDMIGVDIAGQLYNNFMHDGRFVYTNVHEYVFSSMMCFDFLKRSILSCERLPKCWYGTLSRSDLISHEQSKFSKRNELSSFASGDNFGPGTTSRGFSSSRRDSTMSGFSLDRSSTSFGF